MEAAFDPVSLSYDEVFTYSQIGMLQRDRVWSYLDAYLSELQRPITILELNGGTGEDAIRFAQKGHQITLTDISQEMLAVAGAKANANQLSGKIQIQQADLSVLSKDDFSETYDLIFSNFGGLNCLNLTELPGLSDRLSDLLAPGGRFISVIMPRFCIWETFYFLLKLSPQKAFRRLNKEAVIAKLDHSSVPTWYISPRNMRQAFSGHFNFISQRGIGLFIPPSYLESLFKHRRKTLALFNKLETHFPFIHTCSGISDHFLMDLKKK